VFLKTWENRAHNYLPSIALTLHLIWMLFFLSAREMLGEPIATLHLLHYEGIESIAFILGIDTEFSQ